MLSVIFKRPNPKRHVAEDKDPDKHIFKIKLIRVQQRDMESNKRGRFSSSRIEWIVNNIHTK